MHLRPNRFLSIALACTATPSLAAFDETGVMYVSPAGVANNAVGRAVALRADGGFYAAGISYPRGSATTATLELRRFDADGVEDAGFVVSQSHLGTLALSPRSLLVQPDGAVIVATTLANGATPSDTYTRIQRLRSDASGDPAFDDFTFDATFGADRLDILALQADGKLLAAGYSPDLQDGGFAGVVARLLPGGGLDTGFGTDGFVRIDDLSSDLFGNTLTDVTLASVNLLLDGRILLVGSAENSTGSHSQMLFVRLLPDGTPDPTFNGGDAKLYAHLDGNNAGLINQANAADVSPEGVFVIGGRSTAGGSNAACLLQFASDGALQAEACDAFGIADRLTDVQLLPNGGAVGVGLYLDDSFESAALMAIFDGGLQFSGSYSGRFGTAGGGHDLAAVAYDPHRRRLISFGSGITELSGLTSNRWAFASDVLSADLDATPDAADFGSTLEVLPGSEASAARVLTGFDPPVRMPVRVRGGRFAVGGVGIEAAADASPALGFFTSLQQPASLDARVSHLAPAALDQTTVTTLELGGVVRSSNLALTVGTIVTASFSSVTRAAPLPGALFADGFEPRIP